MKKILLSMLGMVLFQIGFAQFGNLLERAKNKVNNKVNQKIDQKMDNAIDKGIDGAEKGAKDATSSSKKTTNETTDTVEETTQGKGSKKSGGSTSGSFKSYSKFDFVPGENLLAAEDFSQDVVGDFPDKWNTNGSGEIVTTNTRDGKFLMTQKEVVFYPEWIKNLPDNFTLEFDLMSSENFSYYSGGFVVGFTSSNSIGKNFREFARFGAGNISNGGGFEVAFHPQNAGGKRGMTFFYSSFNKNQNLKNEADQDNFSEPDKTSVRVSIWRQKTRVRVYMDDKKVWDLPRGISEGLKLESVYFRNDGNSNNDDAFYIGNIRLAVGNPDTRNKLITEGKFVTNGILFDVNSDKIKPESYGAIKDIANVLTENKEVNVQIIGHTDSDGDDNGNLTLSKKRAEAVKAALSKEFGIAASRMTTDGKGESAPVDSNNTALGKAKNRRVEFVKQ
ncbi:MAG TPA: OmpA family protein [Ferruginibacter sp.]|nr:OmpA family protein [Ferruginibacter sp.]